MVFAIVLQRKQKQKTFRIWRYLLNGAHQDKLYAIHGKIIYILNINVPLNLHTILDTELPIVAAL